MNEKNSVVHIIVYSIAIILLITVFGLFFARGCAIDRIRAVYRKSIEELEIKNKELRYIIRQSEKYSNELVQQLQKRKKEINNYKATIREIAERITAIFGEIEINDKKVQEIIKLIESSKRTTREARTDIDYIEKSITEIRKIIQAKEDIDKYSTSSSGD